MKKLLLLLLCVPLIGFGQCISGNCENGVGIFYFTESTKWVGDEFGEKPYVIEASKYIGQWKNGKRDGIGTSISYSEIGIISDIYIGEWKDDRKDGKGTYNLADGEVWEGLWGNDKFLGN